MALGEVLLRIYPVKHFISKSWSPAIPLKPQPSKSADKSSSFSWRSKSVLQLQAVKSWKESRGIPARFIRSKTIATILLSSVSIDCAGMLTSLKVSCNLSISAFVSSERLSVAFRYFTESNNVEIGKCFDRSTSDLSRGTNCWSWGFLSLPII